MLSRSVVHFQFRRPGDTPEEWSRQDRELIAVLRQENWPFTHLSAEEADSLNEVASEIAMIVGSGGAEAELQLWLRERGRGSPYHWSDDQLERIARRLRAVFDTDRDRSAT